MQKYSKIVLLVALALFLTMTACTRTASTAPVASPTGGAGEVPFPVDATPTMGSVADFGTQTAVAQTPAVGRTPQVVVNTPTAGPDGEQGGGQSQEPAAAATATQAPAAPAGTLVPTPVVDRPANYTMQRGEWPICIARRYNLEISSFLQLNGMNMNSKPAAGTILKIPTTGAWSANYGARTLRAHPENYTVLAGDTVYTIACKYGDVTPEAILAVNNLTQASDVKAGVTLRIP